jgi:hypothetical protein
VRRARSAAAAGVPLAAIDDSAGGATVAAQRSVSTTPARPSLSARPRRPCRRVRERGEREARAVGGHLAGAHGARLAAVRSA